MPKLANASIATKMLFLSLGFPVVNYLGELLCPFWNLGFTNDRYFLAVQTGFQVVICLTVILLIGVDKSRPMKVNVSDVRVRK